MRKIVIVAIVLLVSSFSYYVNSQVTINPQTTNIDSHIKIGLSIGLNSTDVIPYSAQYVYNSKSNPRTGSYIEIDVSREYIAGVLLQGGINFNHMHNNAQWGYAVGSTVENPTLNNWNRTINSYDIILGAGFGIKKIGLYFVPSIYMGYLNSKLEWGYTTYYTYDQKQNVKYTYVKKNINESEFKGIDFGYNLEVKIQREFFDKYDIFIGVSKKGSLTDYTGDLISYGSLQVRLGVMVKI